MSCEMHSHYLKGCLVQFWVSGKACNHNLGWVPWSWWSGWQCFGRMEPLRSADDGVLEQSSKGTPNQYVHHWNIWLGVVLHTKNWSKSVQFFSFCMLTYKHIPKASCAKPRCFTAPKTCKEIKALDQHIELFPLTLSFFRLFQWLHMSKRISDCYTWEREPGWVKKYLCSGLLQLSLFFLCQVFFYSAKSELHTFNECHSCKTHIWQINSPQEGKKYFFSPFNFCLRKHTSIHSLLHVYHFFPFCKYKVKVLKHFSLPKRV